MTHSDRPAGAGSFLSVDEDECRELLAVGVIGRVAFDSSAGLQLLPLNYLYLDGGVYFRVATDGLLGELGRGSHDVVFEVDYHDDLIKQAWSVMVKGRVATVTDPEELDALHGRRTLKPWALGDHPLVLRLEPVAITGRKVKRNAR